VITPIRVVCRHPAALGLGLAGLTCTEASDGDTAAAAIAELTRGGGALILIENVLHQALPASLRRQIERDGAPILMPFPGPALDVAGAAPEEELLELLRRSIGYRLRLR
jgi:vacuolar-type H+-ATPase subunit F/Vma7